MSRLGCPTHFLRPLSPLIFSFQVDMVDQNFAHQVALPGVGKAVQVMRACVVLSLVVAASTDKSLWSSVSNHAGKGGRVLEMGGSWLVWTMLPCSTLHQSGRDKVGSPLTSVMDVHAPMPPVNGPLDILYDEIVHN